MARRHCQGLGDDRLVKVLLDTHVLLWTMQGSGASPAARELISSNNTVTMVSIVSLWELCIKTSIGKLNLPKDFFINFPSYGFETLPITLAHIQALRHLPHYHNDPFDRMLVAQAQCEQLLLVTRDEEIKKYKVSLLQA